MADLATPTDGPDFPQSPSAFDADDRISWSKIDEKFILESEHGTEYGWDTALRRWVPHVSQRLHKLAIQTPGLRLLFSVLKATTILT